LLAVLPLANDCDVPEVLEAVSVADAAVEEV